MQTEESFESIMTESIERKGAYVVPTMYPNVLPDGEYLKLFADAARLHVASKEEYEESVARRYDEIWGMLIAEESRMKSVVLLFMSEPEITYAGRLAEST